MYESGVWRAQTHTSLLLWPGWERTSGTAWSEGRHRVLPVPPLLEVRRSLCRPGHPGTAPFSSPKPPPSLHKEQIVV